MSTSGTREMARVLDENGCSSVFGGSNLPSDEIGKPRLAFTWGFADLPKVILKTAYEPNAAELAIYERYGRT